MKKIMLACAVLLTSHAYAASTLTIGEDIKVTAINGQAISQGVFQPHKRQFELDAGRHVITARYDRLFEINRKDHDYLKSSDITLTIELQDNQSYQLVLDNTPQTYEAAKDYAKAPTLHLMQGKVLVAKQTGGQYQSSVLGSLGNLFSKESVANNQQAIASLNTQTTNTQTTTQAPTAPAPKSNTSTLDKFMELWLTASEEEREKIRQWIEK